MTQKTTGQMMTAPCNMHSNDNNNIHDSVVRFNYNLNYNFINNYSNNSINKWTRRRTISTTTTATGSSGRGGTIASFSTSSIPATSGDETTTTTSSTITSESTKSTKESTTKSKIPSNSMIPRTTISIMGNMNVGKSALMNLLTQTTTSIVSNIAGTTTDSKICNMELHESLGPIRLLDTPGINEKSSNSSSIGFGNNGVVDNLGEMKRQSAFSTIGTSDVVIIVVDPLIQDDPKSLEESITSVVDILQQVQQRQVLNTQAYNNNNNNNDDSSDALSKLDHNSKTLTPIPLLIYNIRQDKVQEILKTTTKKKNKKTGSEDDDDDTKHVVVADSIERIEQMILVELKKRNLAAVSLPPTLAVDFFAAGNNTANASSRDRIISFLETSITNPRNKEKASLLPNWLLQDSVKCHEVVSDHEQPLINRSVLLNIPMDQQTPHSRLLRPQAMIQETLLRNYISTICYRMDLNYARSTNNPKLVQLEKQRFQQTLQTFISSNDTSELSPLPLLITDSQAIDIVGPWTIDDNTGKELVQITTFSIAMIHYLSGGRLQYFVDGLQKLDDVVSGKIVKPVNETSSGKWKILISEACNHTRLNMEKECADIGTVQIPNHLSNVLGGEDNVEFDYAFGKYGATTSCYYSNSSQISQYDLVVHCGGCMLTPQQMDSRVADLQASGVACTNYGLLLSKIQSPQTLSRVLRPWGINYDPSTSSDDGATSSAKAAMVVTADDIKEKKKKKKKKQASVVEHPENEQHHSYGEYGEDGMIENPNEDTSMVG